MSPTKTPAGKIKDRLKYVKEVQKYDNGSFLIILDYGRERYSAWANDPETGNEEYICSAFGKPYEKFRKKAEKEARLVKFTPATPEPPFVG